MDPNANLTEMRKLAEQILKDVECCDPFYDIGAHAQRLTELLQALDEWLTKGGFLPNDWKR